MNFNNKRTRRIIAIIIMIVIAAMVATSIIQLSWCRDRMRCNQEG